MTFVKNSLLLSLMLLISMGCTRKYSPHLPVTIPPQWEKPKYEMKINLTDLSDGTGYRLSREDAGRIFKNQMMCEEARLGLLDIINSVIVTK